MVASNYAMIDRASDRRQTMRGFVLSTMVPFWESDALARRVIPCARLRREGNALADRNVMRGMTIGGFLWPQTSSVMVRRDAAVAAGGFDARLARTEDMDLWLKLADRGRLEYVDEVLAEYDITGRDDATGARYAGHDRARLHDRYIEAAYHLRFLQSLPARFALDNNAAAFLRERIAAGHKMCGHAAGRRSPHRAVAHHAASLWLSAGHRRLFAAQPRRYLHERF
jgi:GT2 family glycosyltransferase